MAGGIKENEDLHKRLLDKYFSRSETNSSTVLEWFQETTICFFEKFSFEWFYQVTSNGKKISNLVPDFSDIFSSTLTSVKEIEDSDKEWLKTQYLKFIDSDEKEENLLFWYYGISMFSSRLITARNYADAISIEMFKGSKFILDTNILMILDLKGHNLNQSLKSLEAALITLDVKPIYFNITRDEYFKAITFRRDETKKYFLILI